MSSRGTKVNDPHSIQEESTGAVAHDSLAAESTRANGRFSENRGSEPQGVLGSNSTFANTNTSGATRLDPASDAEARMAEEDWAEEKKLGSASSSYPDAAGGQSKALAVEDTSGSRETGGASSSAGIAPSYVDSQFVDAAGPKGSNLTEGGFESNENNNSSFNSDIGSRNDPGRAAEEKFRRINADATGESVSQGGFSEDTSYGSLNPNAEA